jgi:hypothetical protein
MVNVALSWGLSCCTRQVWFGWEVVEGFAVPEAWNIQIESIYPGLAMVSWYMLVTLAAKLHYGRNREAAGWRQQIFSRLAAINKDHLAWRYKPFPLLEILPESPIKLTYKLINFFNLSSELPSN